MNDYKSLRVLYEGEIYKVEEHFDFNSGEISPSINLDRYVLLSELKKSYKVVDLNAITFNQLNSLLKIEVSC